MVRKTYDTVVVGGGINGCGLAYYLACAGMQDVLVVEGDVHGAGATGGSFGGIRQQFGTPLEIECSRRGLEFWKTVEARFEVPCPFHEDGYLLLTAEPDTAEILEKHASMQKAQGLTNIHLLGPAEVRELASFLVTDDLIYGSWTPEDGHVMPMDAVAGFVKAGQRLGVEFVEHWPVQGIERVGPDWMVRGATDVLAKRVAVVAGAGSKGLLQPHGLDLDIREVDHLSVLTEPAFVGQRVPMTIDLDTGLAVEREGAALVLAMLGRNPAPSDHQALVELFLDRAQHRAPALTDLRIVKRMTAHPTVGGDGHPYVGEVEDGLWVIAFVGHGAMHGPPVAEAVAKAMAGRPDPTLDLSPWNPRRTPGERTVLWRRRASS